MNSVQLVRGGRDYFDTLDTLIKNAVDTIHLQTYIFDIDETGTRVVDALKEAASRGVKVYLLVDGYASQALPKSFTQEMRDAKIHFRYFEPIFRSKHFYFGRRMHHKMVVVDNRFGLVGGLNISNRYNDLPGQPAWLDFAILVEGVIAKSLCILAWKTWYGFQPIRTTPCEQAEMEFHIPKSEQTIVMMKRNDWVRNKDQISRSYIKMLLEAKDYVIILSSYFMPGKTIRRAIQRASARGVKIKVIVAGKSDIKIAKYGEKWFYDWLLRNKIEVYEEQKKILHGKMAVADDQWLTVGSYNINDLSAFASIELNLDVLSPKVAVKGREMLEAIIAKECVRITTEGNLKKRTYAERLLNWSAYQTIRVLFFIFTFYFRQHH